MTSAAAASAGGSDLDAVVEVLDLAEAGPDRFTGRHPERNTLSRTFGGQLLAQSLVAAGRTVEDGRAVHCAQTHFITGGDTRRDLDFSVTRLRDGRAVANRRVDVTQGGATVCTMLAAYHADRPGLEHDPAPPQVAAPETLPALDAVLGGFEDRLAMFAEALHPIDMRYANDPAWVQRTTGETRTDNRVWMRPDGDFPDDPHLHAALMAYASDTTILDPIITAHGLSWGFDRVLAATLNHSMWFHRPARFDDWHLYATESPVAAGTRGTGRGTLFGRDGTARATVVQEGVVRYFPSRV